MPTPFNRFDPTRLWIVCIVGAAIWSLTASGAVAKSPGLTAPRAASQGATATLSVSPRGARACRLVAGGYAGRRQHRQLHHHHPFAVYIEIAKNVHPGRWTLQVRCAGRRSVTTTLEVKGDQRHSGRLLIARLKTVPLGGKRPAGFADPRRRQDAAGAPGTGLTPDQIDGQGGGDGGREQRAIDWAEAQTGRTDFNGWCLRFVAAAFGQPTSYPTATIGANALNPRDGNRSARLAPAGSLVWFNWVDPRDDVNYGHVGISLGDGTMINALDTVRIEPIDGVPYWRSRYRIASSPWSDGYYSPANTFMNGDPWEGPYTHPTDLAVRVC